MKPEARVAAAIEVLDRWLVGGRADQALKDWGRSHRFAGSGDRAAIRDHVFDAIRCKRSFAALGGANTGRGLMIGALRAGGLDPGTVFGTGEHGPAALSSQEIGHEPGMTEAERLDCPDWLWPVLEEDLGPDLGTFLQAGQKRAPICVRVNRTKATLEDAVAQLAVDSIAAVPVAEVETALQIIDNPRRLAGSAALRDGLIEIQDAHSQAVVLGLAPLGSKPGRFLDYCAGAGGKSLAMAAIAGASVDACDISPQRMRDLPDRAARAEASIRVIEMSDLSKSDPYDLVLCDAPCSGSGTWRRDPEAKWGLDRGRVAELTIIQDEVLQRASTYVRPGGVLVYVTCSVLRAENEQRIDAFTGDRTDWSVQQTRRWPVSDRGDGFFRAVLAKQ